MKRSRLVILLALLAAVVATGEALASRQAALPGLMTNKGRWGPNNGAALRPRLLAIGLHPLPREGLVEHIHQRMVVLVNGKFVYVPAGIGIDKNGKFIAELHTHDVSGITHVESPVKRSFTLGEFFDVWGLRFSKNCLGGYCTNGARRVWIWKDGVLVHSDPRKIALTDHLSLVVAYGLFKSIPKPVPKHFPFPKGY